MRYYKGDTMRRVTMQGYDMPEQETLVVKTLLDDRGESSYYVEKHLDGRITLVRILLLADRPWYNHLRAFWDSIFRP